MCIHFSQSLKQKPIAPIKYIGSKALLTLCAEMRVQSDLLITVNDTTVYSTSDKNFLGTYLFLSKPLPYNGNHTLNTHNF